MAKQSIAEGRFQDLMSSYAMDEGMVRELQFAPPRRWRFDFAWPARWLAVEVEGLGRGGAPGRHQRIGGFVADAEKYEAAMLAGWIVYRVPSLWLRTRPVEVAAVIGAMLREEE